MRTATLGDLEVSRIGLGAMGMSHGYTGAGSDDAESIRTIHRAIGWVAVQQACRGDSIAPLLAAPPPALPTRSTA
ncbi:hypothetical protein [Actinoplanes awajinensis]|uniref:NADP-dependent oxidoreductase domain-containing protein n=1 Tax=Actinoplanes awajinensis subsp. mycoplanecinus TaxID=135947 RepID=A0A101JG44_9ACTN|nr:hypothetical protein ADL15_39880 [Actinoplanes awajinensis subsp. mycoplanecinus]